jgi:hypothetical protein
LEQPLLKGGEFKFVRRRPVIKKHLAIALSAILTAISFGLPATARAQSTTDSDKIRARVQTLATSKGSQVQVKFRDKTKLKGYTVSPSANVNRASFFGSHWWSFWNSSSVIY